MKQWLFLLICVALMFSQEEEEKKEFGWTNSVVANLNYTQTGYENWTKGGEKSLSWQSILQYKFIEDQENYNWNTNGKFTFGETKLGSNGEFRKTSDEIKFETVYTYKLGSHVNPYAAFTALTQFSTSFDYSTPKPTKISTFLDPGYFTQSFGIGYADGELFKLRSGLSFKETITSKYRVYSDDPTTPNKLEDSRFETGLEIAASSNFEIMENVNYSSKLEIFSALDAIKRVDVYFDNVFSAKINDILSVSFTYTILYDFDLSSKRQSKDVLAAGISYSIL